MMKSPRPVRERAMEKIKIRRRSKMHRSPRKSRRRSHKRRRGRRTRGSQPSPIPNPHHRRGRRGRRHSRLQGRVISEFQRMILRVIRKDEPNLQRRHKTRRNREISHADPPRSLMLLAKLQPKYHQRSPRQISQNEMTPRTTRKRRKKRVRPQTMSQMEKTVAPANSPKDQKTHRNRPVRYPVAILVLSYFRRMPIRKTQMAKKKNLPAQKLTLIWRICLAARRQRLAKAR